MGRAGSGSGGGGFSGGGHSSSRSSGGHRSSSGNSQSSSSGHRAGSGSRTSISGSFSSSSRPKSSYSSPKPSRPPGGGMGRSMRGSMGGPPPRPPRQHSYGGRDRHGRRRPSIFAYLATMVIIIIILFFVLGNRGQASTLSSTIVRSKLNSVSGFDNKCVIDELNWIDNVSKTESRLKEFFNQTGVQPYILLRDYDAALTTDSEKEAWAADYYEEYIKREDAFLFVYFAEEDTDNDVGYMVYVNGLMTSSVMDSEAVDIFWNNIDRYWYTDMSTDDVLVSAFVNTGKTIMKVPTNGWDVLKVFLIIAGIIVILIFVIIIIIIKAQRAKEKAKEDQRILETDINDYLK